MRSASLSPLLALLLTTPLLADELHPVTVQTATQLSNPDSPFALVVHFTAAEGNEERIIRAFRKSVRLSRQEAGNICYFLTQNSQEPAEFLVYEQWKNLDALDNHLKQPYLQELLPKIEALIAEPPQIDVHVQQAEPKRRNKAETPEAEHATGEHAGEEQTGGEQTGGEHAGEHAAHAPGEH